MHSQENIVVLSRQRAAIAQLQEEIDNATASGHNQDTDSNMDFALTGKVPSTDQQVQSGSLQTENGQCQVSATSATNRMWHRKS